MTEAATWKYVFGPVPSRRLGKSLGVDPIPLKTCNWNCVYCQLGRSTPVTQERKEYVPTEQLCAELEAVLRVHPPGAIDWITFVGSGEPTLHTGLGRMICYCKQISTLPVAVITNGSLLYLEEVRRDLLAADAVMPTVSAGTEELYREIHRPHPEATFQRLISGIQQFRKEYTGQIWIEVMLLHGLNDTEEALRDLAKLLPTMQPDEVQLVLPNRPPAETWVRPADVEGVMRAQAILGQIVKVFHPAEGTFDISGYDNLEQAILGIITRHPMRAEELERSLGPWSTKDIQVALDMLCQKGLAQTVERYDTTFWSAAPSHYPDPAHSQKTSPQYLHSRHK